jgi:E3 ubiquitin-protein ligase synoviolin
MTIFRDEFSAKYVLLFTAHFIMKIFHWVASDRIDYMDQTPVLSTLFHVRIVSLLVVLGCINGAAVNIIANDFFSSGPSMMILFGFEFSILAVIACTLLAKYIIYWIVSSNPQMVDNKSMYIFYLELVAGK